VTPGGRTAKVVVAKSDIQPGKELSGADLTTAEMEADRVPAGAFRDPSALSGRVCESLMVKNQPVLEQMLAPIGSGSGLQALVPAGMRAITMEVNEFSGVAGLIAPGCRVAGVATAGTSIGELRGGGSGATAVAPITTPTTQPIVAITPTTRPHEVIARGDTRRKVKVIRAGQESTVFLNVIDGPSNDTVTDT